MTITSHPVVISKAAVVDLASYTSARAALTPSPGRTLAAVFAVSMLFAGTVMAAPPQVAPPPRPVARPMLLQPSSAARFRQTVQQQQARDSLQKAQVEAQNRQGVSNNSQVPHANNPQLQNQMNQADAAQQNIERARQQDIVNRYQALPVPQGRVVVPRAPTPKPTNGG